MKYQFSSRSYPYGFKTKSVGGFRMYLSDVLAAAVLVVLLAALIGMAAVMYQPVGV